MGWNIKEGAKNRWSAAPVKSDGVILGNSRHAANLICIYESCALSPLSMETTIKSVLTDLQAFDVASLKGRLSELRRYL